MKKEDISDTIILDDKEGYRIISAEEYHYKKSRIRLNFSQDGWYNLLLNKEGIAVERFNPSRKYLDNNGRKIYLDEKGNKVNKEQSNNNQKKSKIFSKPDDSIVDLETEINFQENRGIMYSIADSFNLFITWVLIGPIIVGIASFTGITKLWASLAAINISLFFIQMFCEVFVKMRRSSSTLHEDHASSIGESSFDE